MNRFSPLPAWLSTCTAETFVLHGLCACFAKNLLSWARFLPRPSEVSWMDAEDANIAGGDAMFQYDARVASRARADREKGSLSGSLEQGGELRRPCSAHAARTTLGLPQSSATELRNRVAALSAVQNTCQDGVGGLIKRETQHPAQRRHLRGSQACQRYPADVEMERSVPAPPERPHHRPPLRSLNFAARRALLLRDSRSCLPASSARCSWRS